jgi:hypothetical protein
MDHDQRLVMMLCMTIYDYCNYVCIQVSVEYSKARHGFVRSYRA